VFEYIKELFTIKAAFLLSVPPLVVGLVIGFIAGRRMQ